jgi:hypothetical protein
VHVVQRVARAEEEQQREREQERRHHADGHVPARLAGGDHHRDRGQREHAAVGDPLHGDRGVPHQGGADDAEEPVREAEPGGTQARQPGQVAQPGEGPDGEQHALQPEHAPHDERAVRVRPAQHAGDHEHAAEQQAGQGQAAQRQGQAGQGDREGGRDERPDSFGTAGERPLLHRLDQAGGDGDQQSRVQEVPVPGGPRARVQQRFALLRGGGRGEQQAQRTARPGCRWVRFG